MHKKLNQILLLIRQDLAFLLGISIGIFLFILFFQPFPLEAFDFNNRLIFVSGFGAIVFFTMATIRATLRTSVLKNYTDQENDDSILREYMGGFLIWVVSTVAFAFYLRYVGLIGISFHIMFKVSLICLTPPVILKIIDTYKDLKKRNEELVNEKNEMRKQLQKYESDTLSKSVEFTSETGTDNLNIPVSNVAFIRSADNYVEIVYREADQFKKKLIRNTLKNIEQQLKVYSNFIRSHRICIVNTYYIERLKKDLSSYWLIIKDFDEHIPVSRQYLLRFKELLQPSGGEYHSPA